MDLTAEEVERYLNRVFTASELFSIDGLVLLFKQPDNMQLTKANIIYDNALKKAIDSGILRIDELELLIKKRNLFTDKDKDRLDELLAQKKAQEVILGKTTRVKGRQDRLKNIIASLDRQIQELNYKYISKISMSAERKAEEERALYLCWLCTLNEDETRYWLALDDFLNEKDLEFRNSVFGEFLIFKAGIDTKVIRYLARHSLWRIRYVTSQKVSDPLFGIPTSQYTNDMLNLAYWSNFYQGIYEMMPKDRPPDTIIEDDAALDAYMQAYYKERSREDAAEREKSSIGNRGKLSAFNKEEVIVTRSHELYEDIDYTKPREAQMIKDKTSINKRSKRHR
jgi:hypothetical protein